MDIQTILTTTGNYISQATQWCIVKLGTLGVQTTPTTAKVISILIFGIGIFLSIKLMEKAKPLIKYGLVLLLLFLLVSVGFSFVG
jgi:hypothetical protein